MLVYFYDRTNINDIIYLHIQPHYFLNRPNKSIRITV